MLMAMDRKKDQAAGK
uniref:Uncharacterized protein n=1 Tax=Arundo donax TaxID=35708 RepID=A0A0A8Y7J3_ARUDO